MSVYQLSAKEHQHVTPPLSFVDAPLTPLLTNEKAFKQAHRLITLFRDIQTGKYVKEIPWIEFQLVRGEYDEIER
jgi:hypothetical protein